MNKQYENIIKEINLIQQKRRILNIREDILNKKIRKIKI